VLVEAGEIVQVAAPAPPCATVLCARQLIGEYAELSQWLTAFAEWLVPRKRRKSAFASRAQLAFLDCFAVSTYGFRNCSRRLLLFIEMLIAPGAFIQSVFLILLITNASNSGSIQALLHHSGSNLTYLCITQKAGSI
jgi:hypothetical protein